MKSATHATATPNQTSGTNSGQKPASKSSKDGSAESEPAGNSAPKTASGKNANGSDSGDAASAKSNIAPVEAAIDAPRAEDPALMLKTAETATEQPHSTPETAVPAVEAFALPDAAALSASASANSPAPAATAPVQDETQSPAGPGSLVFQLSLNTPGSGQKTPISPEAQAEAAVLANGEEESSAPQTQSGAADTGTKNQSEQQQPLSLPQLPLTGNDGTIASQFGFQTPLSFAAQVPVAKTENTATAALTRTSENVSTPDVPMAPSVDRVGLTIRGADDQVVRVEINQTGELVQVGVHTGNSDLASELRASVPELVRRLDQQGFESKLSMGASSFTSLAAPVIASAHSEFRSGADANGNSRSNGNANAPQEEPREQRQRNPQRSWRELASQLQED